MVSVFTEDHRAVTDLSIRELLAELTRVEDRLREQAHHAGPHPLPGQVSREASLRRRERALLAELRLRRADPAAGEPHAGSQTREPPATTPDSYGGADGTGRTTG